MFRRRAVHTCVTPAGPLIGTLRASGLIGTLLQLYIFSMASSELSKPFTPVRAQQHEARHVISKRDNRGMYYKVLVNVITACLWLRVLVDVITILHQLSGHSDALYDGSSNRFAAAWPAIRSSLLLAQTFSSFHECAHALTGFVPTNATTAVIQNYARLLVAWLVIDCDAHSRTAAEVIMCLAWAVAETGRYFYLTCACLLGPDDTPYMLLWLRYSLFLVCYPVGIGAEFCLYYSVLPTLVAGQGCPVVLKHLRFGFENGGRCASTVGPYLGYYVCLNVLGYLPAAPLLFGRMMSQRRRKLGSGSGCVQHGTNMKRNV